MKRLISAFAVLAIVGSTLAFKPLGQGTVFCANNPQQTQACPAGALVDITVTTDPNQGSTNNPCSSGLNPYLSTSSTCTPAASGTRFIISDPNE